MKQTIVRFLLAGTLVLAPATAFAHPPSTAHTHTLTVHSHTPTVHLRTTSVRH
jgi:hypothetical protein